MQNAFWSMTGNAVAKGMVVNPSRTSCVCVSDALSYTPSAIFHEEKGNMIESGESMKVFGIHVSNKPTVQPHVDQTVKKMQQHFNSLRHLARYGISWPELVEVYKSTFLPLADYCVQAYHSMLTNLLDKKLELAQVGALRAIYGWGLSARKLREAAPVQTLRAKRIQLTDDFAINKFCKFQF